MITLHIPTDKIVRMITDFSDQLFTRGCTPQNFNEDSDRKTAFIDQRATLLVKSGRNTPDAGSGAVVLPLGRARLRARLSLTPARLEERPRPAAALARPPVAAVWDRARGRRVKRLHFLIKRGVGRSVGRRRGETEKLLIQTDR